MLAFLIALAIFLIAVVVVIVKDKNEKTGKKEHSKETFKAPIKP